MLLTRKEVAELFRVHVGTVDTWRRVGILPGIRVGRTIRFDREAVEKLMKEGNRS